MKISMMDGRWRSITLAGFMGCILLVFCLHCSSNNNINYSNFQTASILPPIKPLHDSFNFINDTEKPALSNKCTVTSIDTEKPALPNKCNVASIDTEKSAASNEAITLIDTQIAAPVSESITSIVTEKPERAATEPILFDKPALINDSIITSIDNEIPAATANESINSIDAEKPKPAANEPIVFGDDTGKPALFNEPIITSIHTEKPAASNNSIASIDIEKPAPANKSMITSLDTEKPAPAKEPITSSTDDTKKPSVETEEAALEEEEEEEEECNIFNGKWVYNPEKSPLYSVSQCPFLGDQVSCQMYGRPDKEYEKWSWEPEGCEIPRFNATDMLERLRNMRVIIVGDSINRNQWESLACLLYSAIPTSRAYVDIRSSTYKVFKAVDYQCSVEFYWSPFLVQLLEPDPASGKKILKLDKLAKSARKWRGANVMLFNTGPWWVHPWQMRKWELFQVGGKVVDNMELELAFERALKTWSNWVDRNVDTAKTQVFFRSMSAEHNKQDHFCYKQTQPILTDVEKKTRKFPLKIIEIVERTIGGMRTPVKYLNITELSRYRIDGHPSIYTNKKQLMLRKHKIQPQTDSDCSHWCLPGVPDTWNLLLYASLV